MEGKVLPIIVNTYSKWLEVFSMLNIQSITLIEKLRNLLQLLESRNCDEGPSFVLSDVEDFLKRNGVTHITSAPYHPVTMEAVLETKQVLAKN